ncbi:hypothetical protein L596_017832 [Steinernema carpocapsae]|uniref:Cation efflux protein transmembrane domain-containing protein n=1 Tax=Steinernema carpocapsae TaxID=34508 RepID=A0A4U5N323_STECR|nr:hypothetical protein L596_017832 [Steinernema carpocapsae]
MLRSLGEAWSRPQGRRACLAALASGCCALFLFYCVSVTRSLVLTGATWLSLFSSFSLLSSIISMTVSHQASAKYSFGLARAPVLAVFAATMLALLSSFFILKEAAERLLEGEHHMHPHPLFLSGAAAASISLLLAAYAPDSQPLQHVLTVAASSSLQEHAADFSHAICYVVPGLSRLLLPRINSMSLLASITVASCLATHLFVEEYLMIDSIVSLVLSLSVFLTMLPLTWYTGEILLQTSPPHILNQLDRCISEASHVDGVLELKSAHFWQLDFSSMVGTVDVRVRRDADEQMVLSYVTEKLSNVVSILTVQVMKDATTAWSGHGYSMPDVPAPAQVGYNFNGVYHEAATNCGSSNGHGHSHSHDDGHGHSHSHGGGGQGHSHDHNDSSVVHHH